MAHEEIDCPKGFVTAGRRPGRPGDGPQADPPTTVSYHSGYDVCYYAVTILTGGSVNRPRCFLRKFCAVMPGFWHSYPPAVLVRGGPEGAPGQVQRSAARRRLPSRPA